MPKILTYNSPSDIEKKMERGNPLKAIWESLLSHDKFTKTFLAVFLLVLIATPFIVNNLLETRQRAEAPPAQMQPNKGDLVKQQTLELLALIRQSRNKSDPEIQSQIISLAKERKQSLLALISENPQAASIISLPGNIKNSLPSEIQADMESADVIEGTLEVDHSDDFDKKTSKEEYFLDSQGKKYSVYFADREPHLLAGDQVKIKGIVLDDKIAVANNGEGNLEAVRSGKKVLGATNVKKLAVILINFQNDTSQPVSSESARGQIFTNTKSVANYYKETSFNLWTLTGDVFGWITIPVDRSTTTCGKVGYTSQAENILAAQGVDLSSYTNVMAVFNDFVGCYGNGSSQKGGRYSWIQTVYRSSGTICCTIHELGHNFGLSHAGALSCTDAAGQYVPISDTCQVYEYVNTYDPMSGGTTYHFNTFHKEKIGYYDPVNIQTVTSSGTYTIDSLEPASAGVKALRIPRRVYNGVVQDYYYAEFRQTYGTFDNFSSTSPAVNGIMINIAPLNDVCPSAPEACGGGADSELINTSAPLGSPTGFALSPLQFGKTFVDAAHGVSIKAVSKTTSTATVEVTFPTQCIREKPSISVEPLVQWGTPGQTLPYSVTVTSNDSQNCNGTTLTLSTGSGDPGFSFNPQYKDLKNMTPGKSATTTIDVTSSPGIVDGFYTLFFGVVNNNLRAQMNANYNVANINPLPTPTPSSSGPTPTFVPITQPATNTGNITGTVSSSVGGVVAGAKITTKVGKTTLTYYTDSLGNYTIPGLAPATYTLKFTAQGYLSQSVSATVTSNTTVTNNIVLQKR